MSLISKSWLYRYGLSFIFSIVIVLSFYMVKWLVPSDTAMYNEVTTFIFIVVSILLLFPIRKKILHFFLQRNIYASLSGSDFTNLDFAELPFGLEALVRTSFPELISWLGVFSASLAILEPNRRSYRIYSYHKKRLSNERVSNRKDYEKLCRYLARQNDGIFLEDESLPDDIRQQMEDLHVAAIYPLLYRSLVMGFFTFRVSPSISWNHAKQAISIFSNRAALSVQNYILSHRVIDFRVYENEFKLAQRVRKALERSVDMQTPNHIIKRLPTESPFVFEFFKLSPKRWISIALFCDRFSESSGIFVYSIIGRLYSFLHLSKKITLSQLANQVKASLNWQHFEHPIHILFIEINEVNKQLRLFTDKKEFSLQIQKIANSKDSRLRSGQVQIKNKLYTSVSIKQKDHRFELRFQDFP